MQDMVQWDPSKRPHAQQIVSNKYFSGQQSAQPSIFSPSMNHSPFRNNNSINIDYNASSATTPQPSHLKSDFMASISPRRISIPAVTASVTPPNMLSIFNNNINSINSSYSRPGSITDDIVASTLQSKSQQPLVYLQPHPPINNNANSSKDMESIFNSLNRDLLHADNAVSSARTTTEGNIYSYQMQKKDVVGNGGGSSGLISFLTPTKRSLKQGDADDAISGGASRTRAKKKQEEDDDLSDLIKEISKELDKSPKSVASKREEPTPRSSNNNNVPSWLMKGSPATSTGQSQTLPLNAKPSSNLPKFLL
jgi:hypothetical protein